MPIVTAYSMPVGAQRNIPYSATNDDGTAFNLTGYTLRFSISRTLPATGAYVLQKDSAGLGGVTIVSPTAGTATLNMVTADTLSLSVGVYYFDVVAVSGAAQVPLTTGTFTLTERVSR